MKTSEQINELATAMATAQAAMQPAKMNATNPFLKNRYADLGAVIDAVRDGLAGTGLSYVQFPAVPPVEYGPAIALTTRVMHTSGQWLEDTFIMSVPAEERGKSTMQVAGSAITYARRYALAAVFGVVADEDTDGNAPQKPRQSTPRTQAGTNGHATPEPPADGDLFPEDAKPVPMKKPTDAQLKAMHAAGSAFYGGEWDTKRAEIVSAVTKGRTTSSKHLTADECKTIIDGINRKATA